MIKLNHTTYGLVNVPPEAFGRIRLGATAPVGTSAALALVGRIGGVPGGQTVLKMKTLPNGGSGTVTLENPGNFSRITMVLVNSDYKVSGGSQLTGEWIYKRDAQPYYARVSTDLRAPRVVRVSPRSRARRIVRRPHVKVTFSEPVRGVSSKTVQLVARGGHVVGASVQVASGGRVAILTPRRPLSRARSYRLRVLKTVTDTTVNPLAKTFTSSFTTKR
jgi:nitrogen fixation protein FixH